MPIINSVTAHEILDSRGRPTVKARCELAGGIVAEASIPSGASTGAAEALELRDGDPRRYGGLGCLKAVANVNTAIADALRGVKLDHQSDLDAILIRLDGTPNKSKLGANAILATSIAFARASAGERRVPLYRHLADMIQSPLRTLPRLTVNLFSGGKHAGGQVAIQDVLLVPTDATVREQLAAIFAVYQAAARIGREKYGARSLTADEGGLAPPFKRAQDMLEDAVEAIGKAGLRAGKDMMLAVDVASTHFYQDGRYEIDGDKLDGHGMIDRAKQWTVRFPIVSIEDALFEDDWAAWPRLRQELEGRALILGDDFLCTNPARIRRAVESKAANALLLKVNQIGTLTEAAEALRVARAAGWAVTISARSGETEDSWLADLAVGWAGDQIKVGSITHSERLAKYNRLLEIESETNLPVVNWPKTT